MKLSIRISRLEHIMEQKADFVLTILRMTGVGAACAIVGLLLGISPMPLVKAQTSPIVTQEDHTRIAVQEQKIEENAARLRELEASLRERDKEMAALGRDMATLRGIGIAFGTFLALIQALQLAFQKLKKP